jgi:hypothetical protein
MSPPSLVWWRSILSSGELLRTAILVQSDFKIRKRLHFLWVCFPCGSQFAVSETDGNQSLLHLAPQLGHVTCHVWDGRRWEKTTGCSDTAIKLHKQRLGSPLVANKCKLRASETFERSSHARLDVELTSNQNTCEELQIVLSRMQECPLTAMISAKSAKKKTIPLRGLGGL